MGVVFIDTETTGVDARRHNIWEIGLIEEDGTEHEWLLNPDLINLEDADPMALFITHYYERMPSSPFVFGDKVFRTPDVAQQVARLTAGKHLVGAVPSFDATFLTKLFLEHGLTPAWHYHLVDVEALAAGKLGVEPPWDSGELAKMLGIPELDGKHTAIGDARWAKAIYYAVLGAVKAES